MPQSPDLMSDEIQQDRIDALLDDAIRRIRAGESVNTQHYCQLHPDLADEIQLLMSAVLLLEKPIVRPVANKVPLPMVSGYNIVREIGRGAMGVVYEAVQKQLNRKVALKLIRANAEDRIQIARFCREASTAARLQHPNIVSVFDSGESDGLAYYSMQLIEGRTLQQILMGLKSFAESTNSFSETNNPRDTRDDRDAKDDHDDRDTRSLPASADRQRGSAIEGARLRNEHPSRPQLNDESISACGLTPTRAAKHVLQVAEALAYAHSQGVLHRDIKPSNIIIDDDGRAWITDFGLAWHADAESLTANGDIVGTVRYLAPEGFSGESSEQSDVYSLGLTLFELLEGQPAFLHTDRARLIHEIMEGRTPQLTVNVPVDLATICGKCIQRNPQDRYATADLLATDLRNFLAGRPIAARRLSLVQKAVRWCDRNRIITALGLLLVVFGGCAIVANHFWSLDAERLKAESKASSELAQTNLNMLLKTVDRFCQTVSEDRRMYRPEYQELRELLLESADGLNNQFVSNPAVSQDATLHLAGVFRRLGRLGSTKDTLVDCEGYLIKARNLLLDLPEVERQQPDVAIELLGCYQDLGRIYSRMNEVDSSKKNLQDSITIADQILIRNAEENEDVDVSARMGKSVSLSVLARVFLERRDFEPSETAIGESIQLVQDILTDRPNDTEAQIELANQWTFLGHIRMTNLRKWKQAEEPFRNATELYSSLPESESKRPDVQFSFAVLLQRTARWLYMSKQLGTATETQRQACNILQDLANRFENDLAFQLESGIAYRVLADLLIAKAPSDLQALEIFGRSEAVLSLAVAGDKLDSASVLALANTCIAQADTLAKRNHTEEALASVDRAISTLNLILNDDPTHAAACEFRYFAAVTKAEALTSLEQFDAAFSEWDVAIRLAPSMFGDLASLNRTRTLALSGDVEGAISRVEEILSQQPEGKTPPRHHLSAAAQTFAIAARMSGLSTEDQKDPDPDSPGELYARRSVELLDRYFQTGAGQKVFVSSCPDFDCLRDRDDFLAMMSSH